MDAHPPKEPQDPGLGRPSLTWMSPGTSNPENVSMPAQIGRYRVLAIIGRGGMGTVFKAKDAELDRVVAVKVPRLELATYDLANWRKRFLREAQAAAKIRHPHVCPIYDVGEHEGTPFVVMAYVDGPTLSQCLSGQHPYGDPVRAARLVRQVAQALHAVHSQGLVHRDLKPGNILIEPDDQAVLTDFGLARPDQDAEHLTKEGMLLGTPAYMAPEQAAGQEIGPQADLYSLGVVLYRLLTGRLPYVGNTVEVLRKIGHETPPLPSKLRPELDPALERLVLKAMAPKTEDRYASAAQFAEELSRWLEQPAAGSSTPQLEVPTKSYLLPEFLPDSDSDQKKSTTPDTDEMVEAQSPPPPGRRRLPVLPAALAASTLIGTVFLVWYLNRTPSASITPNGKNKNAGGLEIQPEPRVVREGGMSAAALVRAPAKIPGLLHWTVETRLPRGAVWALAFSPDGKWLAQAGQDGMVRLWRRSDRSLANILVGHDRPVRRLAWSPDGHYLASSGDDGSVRLWHAESGMLLRTLSGHVGSVSALAWSSDGLLLAGGGQDKKVLIWKTVNGHVENILETPSKVAALAWSPDGKWLASAGSEKPVRLWQMPSGQGAPLLGGHDFPMIHELAWLPDQTLVSAGQDNTIRFWSAGTRRQLNVINLPAPATALAAAPKENIVVGGTVNSVQLWDSEGKALGPLGRAVGPVHALAWAPEGNEIAIVGEEGTTRLWQKDNQPVWDIASHPGGPCGVAWSPKGDVLAVAGFSDHALRLWDAGTGLLRLQKGRERYDPVVAWSPDGALLANGGSDGKVRLFDPAKVQWRQVPGPGHAAEVLSLAWSRDLKLLSAGADGTVRLHDVARGNDVPIKCELAWCVAWSPDGKYPALGGLGPYVWEHGFGKPTVALPGKQSMVQRLAWSMDGRLLAEALLEGGIRIRAARAWKLLAEFSAHAPAMTSGLAWSPDGKILASAARDGALAFWDESGKSLARLSEPTAIHSMSWSEKSNRLALGRDGAATVINGATKKGLSLLVPLADRQALVLNESGNYQTSADKQTLVYVILTESGSQMLTSEAFSQRFNWSNDPQQARLVP